MAKPTHALVLDVGTSSIKAFVFNRSYTCLAMSERKLSVQRKGLRVEQDPEEYVRLSRTVLRDVFRRSTIRPSSLVMGITNQRETVVVWERKTGKPIYPAIVWQDRRTQKQCVSLRKHGRYIRSKTGLSLSPYFSATKLSWILTQCQNAQTLLNAGQLLCGTVDTWLLWNLLEGNPHSTDSTNASRTLLFDIHALRWDNRLMNIFGVQQDMLPTVHSSRYAFGMLKKDILGAEVPVRAVCGDQQASMAAAGLTKRTTKVTYGTGTFVMQSLGSSFAHGKGFFTTLIPHGMTPRYALEAKIDTGGTDVEKALGNQRKLHVVMTSLAQAVDDCLQGLPIKPRKIIIDGGVTRDGQMGVIQAEVSCVPIQALSTFRGTALGIAKLLLDASNSFGIIDK